jgi:uncharacterized membrane protein
MDAKTIAWVSYLTLIGWIIAFVSYGNMNPKGSLATFHLRQSFGLILLGIVSSLIFRMLGGLSVIGILSPIVWILLIVLWILGLLAAVNGEEKPVPVVGTYFQQWFQFIK